MHWAARTAASMPQAQKDFDIVGTNHPINSPPGGVRGTSPATDTLQTLGVGL